MTTALEVRGSTEVAAPMQQQFTREQVDLIKRTVCQGASDDELRLFLHVAEKSGLDPFARQIHAVKRWNNQQRRETMAIQTGIDGYRLIADRTGQYAGNEDAEYGPEILDGKTYVPTWAKVTVHKLVGGAPRAFSATARWSEYRQTKKDGALTAMWERMPFLMLAKCAEALALRKAFPAELSGLYTHEEMAQADSGSRQEEPPAAGRKAVEERAGTNPEPPPPPTDAPPPPANGNTNGNGHKTDSIGPNARQQLAQRFTDLKGEYGAATVDRVFAERNDNLKIDTFVMQVSSVSAAKEVYDDIVNHLEAEMEREGLEADAAA